MGTAVTEVVGAEVRLSPEPRVARPTKIPTPTAARITKTKDSLTMSDWLLSSADFSLLVFDCEPTTYRESIATTMSLRPQELYVGAVRFDSVQLLTSSL